MKNNSDFSKKIENWTKNLKNEKEGKKPWEKKGDFVGEIIGNLVVLLIINFAPRWFPGFFTSVYPALLSVANTVILMQIMVFVILLVFSPRWLYYLGKSATNLFGFISIVTAIVLFPFNIPYGLSSLFRFGLTVGGIVTIVVSVIYLLKATFAVINIK